MRRRDFLAAGLGASAIAAALPAAREAGAQSRVSAPASSRTIRIVLAGDSTVTDGSGWGFGFKQYLGPQLACVNTAANGRSSRSFIDEGRWRDALALRADYYLIQFGHNDEPGKGAERETDPRTTYRANLSRYVDEARAIGATPVLVTSLTRRRFTASGTIVPNLDPYVAAVKAVAAAKRVPLVDLHQRSIALAEQLGDEAWAAMSPRAADGSIDRTHLNTRGSLRVAPLVIAGLRATLPELGRLFRDAPIADAIVAADGSADYTTVQAAIDALPQDTRADRRWTIVVRAGTYRELVYVQREKRFVTLRGEDPAQTTITYDLHANRVGLDGRPIGTYRTPTVVVDADDFIVEGLTLENGAGPVGQALALRVNGDRVAFRNCRFLGWQDTVFLDRGRQYFEDAFIAGHVDFIFGGATAWFERAHLHCRRDGYITAASTPPEQPYGFVFANSRITGETRDTHAYLGRPWRDFAQVTFLDTAMSEVVRPEGWHDWNHPERARTVRYAEFGGSGPGARETARVPWAKRLSSGEAAAITVAAVLGGADGWDPRE